MSCEVEGHDDYRDTDIEVCFNLEMDSRAGRSDDANLIATGTGKNMQFSGFGLIPNGIETYPFTPNPSPDSVIFVSTVMWTAGNG